MLRNVACLIVALVLVATAQADLVCEQPVAQLGTVKAGATLKHRFTLTNKSTGTVELVGFKTSCGCFKPELQKHILVAGETVALDLIGNTLTQSAGPQAWRIRLAYREAGEDRELAFEIRATLQVELAVVPSTLTITTAGVLSHPLSLRDLRQTPLPISGIQTTNPGLRAKFGEAEKHPEGGWTRSIVVEVGNDYPPGRRDEMVVIHSRDPDYPEVRVPVTVHKKLSGAAGAIEVRPTSVVIVGTPSEALPSRLVQLGDGTRVLEIDRIETGHEAILCTHATRPGVPTTVKVRVEGSMIPKAGLDSAIRVFVRGGDRPIVIPVRVEWRP